MEIEIKLTDLILFLLSWRAYEKEEEWEGLAVLARNPVKTLGAFQAHESTLQSYLPLPSPFVNLHILTHSTGTVIKRNKNQTKAKRNQQQINK